MPILADTVELVIGVDPAQAHPHPAVVTAATGKKLGSVTVSADPDGLGQLLAAADAHEGSRCWVIEGCGSWGRGLATWLPAHGETVHEIDSARRPPRRMGKENDDIDATRRAEGKNDREIRRCLIG